jgi:hypothetical protein
MKPKPGPKLMLVLGFSGSTKNGKEKDIFDRTGHLEAARSGSAAWEK